MENTGVLPISFFLLMLAHAHCLCLDLKCFPCVNVSSQNRALLVGHALWEVFRLLETCPWWGPSLSDYDKKSFASYHILAMLWLGRLKAARLTWLQIGHSKTVTQTHLCSFKVSCLRYFYSSGNLVSTCTEHSLAASVPSSYGLRTISAIASHKKPFLTVPQHTSKDWSAAALCVSIYPGLP